jgi:hypothetical protein
LTVVEDIVELLNHVFVLQLIVEVFAYRGLIVLDLLRGGGGHVGTLFGGVWAISTRKMGVSL